MDRSHTPTPETEPPRSIDDIWRDDRRYLVGLASGMLGDPAEAEDVVQDAFGRLVGVELDQIQDVRAWLTVVVRRLCLNRIQSAYTRREAVAGAAPPEDRAPHLPLSGQGRGGDPADRVTLDSQVQLALAVVLDRLTPAERTSFVLHDVFGFPYTAIGEIVGRTPAACRKLASRARRAIRNSSPSPEALQTGEVTADDHSILAERFIAACSGGDIAGLLEVLDPDVVGEATLLGHGRVGWAEGAHNVATETLKWVGQGTETTLLPVSVEGNPGAVAIVHGHVRVVMRLDEAEGTIRRIRVVVVPPKRQR